MNRRFCGLLLGLLPALPSFAQVPTDTTQTPAPQQVAPVPQTVAPTPAAPAAATPTPPPRIDVTEAKAPLQAPVYVPLDRDVYRLIDRYAIKYGPDSTGDIQTAVRPFNRAAVVRLAERAQSGGSTANLSRADQFNLDYLRRDNWQASTDPASLTLNQSRRPFLKSFYRNQTDFYHVNTPDFKLRVNPVIHVQAGNDTEVGGLRFVNTRGAQVEGVIDQRLGFFAYVTDNQMAVPDYVRMRVERDSIVPHEAYWKPFKDKAGQYDFITARGYLTYAATRHVNVQLGHDRNFIGNGYRSLILSDYAAPYFFLKLNTRVWKLNYQNLFAELNADRGTQDRVDPKKYMALHHLSVDITPSLNVGVFESVIFARRAGRFELQYLNPIIFYRGVEQAIGSDDNALLGADFKWNIRRRVQLYGQLMLDEFKLSEIRAGDGWWANKQAFQLGGRYLDVFGIQNLDAQGEYSWVRPYTYQHIDFYTGYSHYQQPLAHDMGANVREAIGILSYQPQPLPRLTLVGKLMYSQQGLDRADPVSNPPRTLNYGGNVLRPYTTRVQEYGNTVGQGLRHDLLHADFTATFQARHNLWLDAKVIARNSNLFGNALIPSVSLRWNAAQRLHEF